MGENEIKEEQFTQEEKLLMREKNLARVMRERKISFIAFIVSLGVIALCIAISIYGVINASGTDCKIEETEEGTMCVVELSSFYQYTFMAMIFVFFFVLIPSIGNFIALSVEKNKLSNGDSIVPNGGNSNVHTVDKAKVCPMCGAKNSKNSYNCKKCGYPL